MKKQSIAGELFILCFFILLLMVFAGYFFLAYYYQDGFRVNTWINGVYCTGKTVEEVNEELMTDVIEPPVIVISTNSGRDADYDNVIDLGEMDFRCDYISALNEYMASQNPFLWVDNIFLHQNNELHPKISYDEKAFREAFEQTCVRQYSERLSRMYILLSIDEKDGWSFHDGLTHRIDMDRALKLVKEAIDEGQYEINIDELDCFHDIPLTEEQEEIRSMWERLQGFINSDLVYDMGAEQIALDPAKVSYFLKYEYREDLQMDYPLLDEQGQFILNEEEIRKFVADLAEEYDTYGKDREFQSSRGDLVTVPSGGTYGTTLDQEAEVEFLMENLFSDEMHTGEASLHIPAYEKQGYVRGKDDIGGTYIEIDMTEQHMYYYKDFQLVLDTDVVTGNINRRMGTPEGINYVYYMQRDRVLRGPGYASPVKFWMAVKGAVGIHDASWQPIFGGERYKTNGSRGCINTPTDVMAELYDMTELGTPVLMFY